jgi:hypothetical protein
MLRRLTRGGQHYRRSAFDTQARHVAPDGTGRPSQRGEERRGRRHRRADRRDTDEPGRLVVGEQAGLRPAEHRKVTLLVDELQATPGANYEALLRESAKFGASLILATKSLARIDALDRTHERALRPTLFARVDGILAFQTGDDARPLSRELAGEVEPADLLNLMEYRCYAKLFSRGQPLPTFSVHLDPPPQSDEAIARRLASESARQFGREVAEVTRSLQAARAEYQQARARDLAMLEAARRAAAKAKKHDRRGGAQGRPLEQGTELPYQAGFVERATIGPNDR